MYDMTQVTQKESVKICTIYLFEKKNEIAFVRKWREKSNDINEFDWRNIFELPF